MTRTKSQNSIHCQLCDNTRRADMRRALLVRPAIVEEIQRDNKAWDENGWICVKDLQNYQYKYVHSLLEAEKGDLTELEFDVLEGLRQHEILARNPEVQFETQRSIGQRLADKLAAFGGSWSFIIFFAFVLFGWLFINSYVLAVRPFDPYPYILLNLVLAALAALQAPVIMMSQNRQEARDRLRSMYDYKINLKAELEIRQLHQKIDHLLSHQWERLVQIQEVQMELINEIRGSK